MARILDRVVRFLTGEDAPREEDPLSHTGSEAETRTEPSSPPENDAAAYGVTVEEAHPAAGTLYWQVRRVHHLTPEENRGRHHIFIEAWKPDGTRAFGSRARVTWEGGEQVVPVDKPLTEPGANFPMWKWQVCSVEMLDLPSDKVHNLRTDHPDEPNPDGTTSGNTLFHHSFLVEFQQAVAPAQVGQIQGRVENGLPGLPVRLWPTPKGESPVAETRLAPDGTFGFAEVAPGDYLVAVDDVQEPVTVAAGATTPVTLVLLAAGVIQGVVHGGQGRLLRLLAGEERVAEGILPASGRFRLRNLPAGTYFLEVWTPNGQERLLRSQPLAMDGRSTLELELPLEDPTSEKPSVPPAPRVFVLFGDPTQPHVREQVEALAPALAAWGLDFGFDPEMAARAQEVFVVGDGHTVSEFELISLWHRGVKVHRLTGPREALLQELEKLATP